LKTGEMFGEVHFEGYSFGLSICLMPARPLAGSLFLVLYSLLIWVEGVEIVEMVQFGGNSPGPSIRLMPARPMEGSLFLVRYLSDHWRILY
jgi:hypothetical protein